MVWRFDTLGVDFHGKYMFSKMIDAYQEILRGNGRKAVGQ